MAQRVTGGTAYRIRVGQSVALYISILSVAGGGSVEAAFRVEYDDGSSDTLSVAPLALTSLGDQIGISNAATQDGFVVSGSTYSSGADAQGAIFAKMYIIDGTVYSNAAVRQVLGVGYASSDDTCAFGAFQRLDFYATYVFQGTIAEDATGGTHVCTLTVTPGAGNSIEVVGGAIQVGNTATAQGPSAFVDDGTNILFHLLNPDGTTETNASAVYEIPTGSQLLSNLTSSSQSPGASWGAFKISGSMRLILKVSTAAVSVTQTFSMVVRIRGTDLPTVALADTVGTPVLTTNTNALF